MLSFFRKRKAPVPALASRPIAEYRFGWTLEHFRSEPSRVDDMRKLLRDPFFQRVMSVLQHELPMESIEAVRGHRRCMRILELMGEHPPKSPDEIQATYGAEKEFPDLTTQNEAAEQE